MHVTSSATPAGDDITPLEPQHGLNERIAQAGRDIAALQCRLDEALAALGHARRRGAADLARAGDYALQDLARDLLPFRDALEATLAVETADVAALRQGLELARRQLAAALGRHARPK